MKQIKASEFKARCLKLMDEVAETHEPLVITKNGRPIATLYPFDHDEPQFRGSWKGRLRPKGDIVGPIDAGWETEP